MAINIPVLVLGLITWRRGLIALSLPLSLLDGRPRRLELEEGASNQEAGDIL
jgi:hypothetical protein